ncbi:DUF4157 domain-containing protein [Novosphingobium resinovorum]
MNAPSPALLLKRHAPRWRTARTIPPCAGWPHRGCSAGCPHPAGQPGTRPDCSPQRRLLLPGTVRRQAEAQLGIDLAGVRLHTGAEARERTHVLGANAFALGDEVVLGAGAGAPVLLHELAHVAQARTGAAPPIALHDDPPRPRGIGSAPPRDAFERGEGVMPETGHVLFERDSADLDPGDVATIEGLMRGRSRRLWVDVYGYASLEGDDAYNANLSAHRGVAVRRAIEPLLPPGSLLDVHAQGEVQDFGPVEENRRVGIRLRDAPELSSIGLLGDFRLQLDPSPLVGGVRMSHRRLPGASRRRPPPPRSPLRAALRGEPATLGLRATLRCHAGAATE